LGDYARSSGLVNGTGTEIVDKIISHPHLAFRMIYRFVMDIPKFNQSGTGRIIGQKELRELIDCEWPSSDDLGEAIEGLLRMSFMFDLQLDEASLTVGANE